MDIEHIKASDGTGNAVLAHVTAPRAIASTVLEVDSVDNWPQEFIVTTGVLNAQGFIEEDGKTEMSGHLDSGDIIIDGFEPGYSDIGNTTDDVAIIKPTTGWANRVAENEEALHEGTDVVDQQTGRLGNIRTYLTAGSPHTWEKPADLKFIIVEVQAGGGGGGGSDTTNNVVGSGGAGGGFSFKKILAASLGANETVTVGAAGAAGTSTGNGGAGGNSSFGAHATATGGGGGFAGSQTGGTAGAGASGDVNIAGQSGMGGGLQNSTINTRIGTGGSSRMGLGGTHKDGGSNSTGEAGSGYGAGGSGGLNNSASRAGGAGTAGIIRVWEFF